MKTTNRSARTGPTSGTATASSHNVNHLTGSDTTTATTVASSYFFSGFDGVDIGNYHRLVAAGTLIPYTPYRKWEIDCNHIYGRRHLTLQLDATHTFVSDTPSNWYGLRDDDFVDVGLLKTYVDAKNARFLLQQAAADLASSGFDALTFIAELHKTVSMFSSFVTRFRQWLLNGPPGKFSNGDVFNTWLEGRYGWRLFLYDMIDIQKQINRSSSLVGRVKKHKRGERNFINISNRVEPNGNLELSVTVTDTISVQSTASIASDMLLPGSARFNLLSTSYELLRFSFVVDWIVNLGQVINALSYLATTTSSTSCIGGRVSLVREVKVDSHPSPTSNFPVVAYDCESYSTYNCYYNFRAPSDVPLQPFVLPAFSVIKVVDLIALAGQFITRWK